mgnify:CR=1 FL=1
MNIGTIWRTNITRLFGAPSLKQMCHQRRPFWWNSKQQLSKLCYGGFFKDGFYVKQKDGKPIDLKLTDLTDWGYASPALDLYLVLYLKADQNMKNEHCHDLTDKYYEALQSTFPQTDVPSKEAILMEFRTTAVVAFFAASRFLRFFIAHDNEDMPQQGQ